MAVRSASETFTVRTRSRCELVDITAGVQSAVQRLGMRQGACVVFVPHTTAGVTVNEGADPDVARDILTVLERLVPERGSYRHAEGNADAHAKAVLVGNSQVIPVENGRLRLGTWQAVFLCEFDGPRERRVWVTGLGAEVSVEGAS